MPNARLGLVLLALAALDGCAGDAGAARSEARVLVDELMVALDNTATRQCTCLVDQGVLYDSLEACFSVLGQEPGVDDCMVRTLEERGNQAQLDALRCYTNHLQTTSACGAAATCEEVIEGACIAAAIDLPCNQAVLAALDFLLGYCPDLSMFD
jgi:hypothetical protein